ncbi:UvrD-helicase domain-containing protein [Candidatus Dependentiae bacterium]|nr:UvrD-helicase domain-containing protein [Candidatus Dependentiae bacterium]
MKNIIWSEDAVKIFEFEKNFCVQAGAGSGKTTALVELYINLLKKKCNGEEILPENILAITFTEKAAAEMKDRVFLRIESELKSNEENYDFWEKIIQSLRFASISTFHGFCANIIKEYSIETGIAYNFSIINETEKNELITKFVSEIFKELISEKYGLSEKIFLEFGSLPKISEEIGSLYNTLKNRGILIKNIFDNILIKKNKFDIRYFEKKSVEPSEKIRLFLEEILEISSQHSSSPTLKKVYKGLCNLGFDTNKNLLNIERLIELDNVIAGNWGPKFKNLKDGIKTEIDILKNFKIMPEIYEYSLYISEILVKLDEKMYDYKLKNSIIDFDDLIIFAVELFENNSEIIKTVKKKFRYVLVDEYQDTNFMQEKLIKLLGFSNGIPDAEKLFIVGDVKQSIYKFRGAEASIMKKWQKEFNDKYDNCSVKFFPENRRTVKSLIKIINELFSIVMDNSLYDFGIKYIPENIMSSVRGDIIQNKAVCEFIKIISRGEENSIEEHSEDDDGFGNDIGIKKYSSNDLRSYEAEFLAGKINEIVNNDEKRIFTEDKIEKKIRTSKFGDITVLFRSFTDIKIYENKFREYGIPYYVVKGRGFYDCPEIIDLIIFLKIISNPSDKISFSGVLRSPFLLLNDNQIAVIFQQLNNGIKLKELNFEKKWFSTDTICRLKDFIEFISWLQENYSKYRVFEILNFIIEKFNYKIFLVTKFNSVQQLANLDKLLHISDNFDRNDTGILEDFIKLIDRLSETSANESEAELIDEKSDCVKLMTIHQSKGLEFPIVIIPDISRKPNYRPKRIIATENDLTIKINNLYSGKIINSEYSEFENIDKLKEIEENKRVFYTACTRARDYLIFIGFESSKKKSDTWMEWLDKYLESFSVNNEEKKILYSKITIEEIPNLNFYKNKIFNSSGYSEIKDFSKNYFSINRFKCFSSNFIEISPTSLAVFSECPRKFFYSYIAGITDFSYQLNDFGGKVRYQKDNCIFENNELTYLEKDIKQNGILSNFITAGLYAHYILEKIDIRNQSDKIQKNIIEYSKPYSFKLENNVMGNVNKSVLNAAEIIKREIIRTENFNIERELPFYLKLNDSETELSVYINGIIDLLIYNEEEIYIVDYKYSKYKENNFVNRMQLIIYSFAVYELFNKFPDKLYIFYLKEPEIKLDIFGLTDENYLCEKNKLIQSAKQIVSINNLSDKELFPINTFEYCKNKGCIYENICFNSACS